MPFTLTWTSDADAELARLFLNAPARLKAPLSAATNEIERQLKFTGNQVGSHVPGEPEARVYAEPVNDEWLLAVSFRFVPDDMMVTIYKPYLMPRMTSHAE